MFLRNRSSAPPKDASCLQDKVQAPYQIFLNLASISFPNLSTSKIPAWLLSSRNSCLGFLETTDLQASSPLLRLFPLVGMVFPTPFSAGKMAAVFRAQLKCLLFCKAFLVPVYLKPRCSYNTLYKHLLGSDHAPKLFKCFLFTQWSLAQSLAHNRHLLKAHTLNGLGIQWQETSFSRYS